MATLSSKEYFERNAEKQTSKFQVFWKVSALYQNVKWRIEMNVVVKTLFKCLINSLEIKYKK